MPEGRVGDDHCRYVGVRQGQLLVGRPARDALLCRQRLGVVGGSAHQPGDVELAGTADGVDVAFGDRAGPIKG